ncbi:MAG: phage terminase small subunit P27 family [Phycisphaerales bacterium]|nr:phage terminase small subunit P27 family [Phycisphaerales bacterium]
MNYWENEEVGERGPAPTPSAIKEARGTYRADRAAPHEPKAVGKPTCPKWLPPEAKREFHRLVKELAALGVLGRIDGNSLARYCATWLRWNRMLEPLLKHPSAEIMVYKDTNGRVKAMQVSAAHSVVKSLAEELGRLEGSFGMTPSARTRISTTSKDTPEFQLPE